MRLDDTTAYTAIDVSGAKFFRVAGGLRSYGFHIPHAPPLPHERAWWELDLCDTPPLSTNNKMFVVVDTLFDEAFGHWVYESAVYLSRIKQLMERHPSLMLACKSRKTFKTLFLDYFQIPAERVVYTTPDSCTTLVYSTPADPEAVYLFPSPVASLNDHYETQEHKQLIDELFETFGRIDVQPAHSMLIMPRQTRENFRYNNRNIPLSECCARADEKGWKILATDTIACLDDQIRAVQSAHTVVVTDGSAFLVNGMFAHDQHIAVVDSAHVTEYQAGIYKKMAYIIDSIKRRNKSVRYATESELLK